MKIGLIIAEIHVPSFIRKREFSRLVDLTAEAFEAPRPAFEVRSFEEMLDAYASWTGAQAESLRRDPARPAAVRTRLRGLAVEFGRRLRKKLGVRTRGEVMRAGRLLYRLLHIDFEGSVDGGVIIRRCSFSRRFSPETCALLAALDEGILAGLAGGGRLEFTARITENDEACRARFVFPEGLP